MILLKLENAHFGQADNSGNCIQIESSLLHPGALFIGEIKGQDSLAVGVHLTPAQEYQLLELLMRRKDEFILDAMNKRLANDERKRNERKPGL